MENKQKSGLFPAFGLLVVLLLSIAIIVMLIRFVANAISVTVMPFLNEAFPRPATAAIFVLAALLIGFLLYPLMEKLNKRRASKNN